MRLIIIAIIGIIAGPFLAYEGYTDRALHQQLDKEGVEVSGVPTEGHSSGRRRSRTYKLSVVYPVKGGSSMTKEFKVTSSYFASMGSEGAITVDKVPVKYLPSDPTKAIIPGGSTDEQFLLWLGPIICLGGVAFLIYAIMKRKQSA
jgi:hypothetical protein